MAETALLSINSRSCRRSKRSNLLTFWAAAALSLSLIQRRLGDCADAIASRCQHRGQRRARRDCSASCLRRRSLGDCSDAVEKKTRSLGPKTEMAKHPFTLPYKMKKKVFATGQAHCGRRPPAVGARTARLFCPPAGTAPPRTRLRRVRIAPGRPAGGCGGTAHCRAARRRRRLFRKRMSQSHSFVRPPHTSIAVEHLSTHQQEIAVQKFVSNAGAGQQIYL